MNVELIVDSTVDVPEHIRSRLTVVPLTIHFGQEEYLDGVTMDKHRFYERLVESDVLPTTSQASPAAFDREFRRVRRSGGSAVVLTIAAQLSGTYQSACIAAAEYDNIYVVDSGTAAIGAGILAEYALTCLDRGMDAAGLARALEQKRQDVCVLALVDTLEYLKRGGRISKTTALAGGLLNIKPVLTIENGEILLVGKARGSPPGQQPAGGKNPRLRRHRLFPAHPPGLHGADGRVPEKIRGGQPGPVGKRNRPSGFHPHRRRHRHPRRAWGRGGGLFPQEISSPWDVPALSRVIGLANRDVPGYNGTGKG